MKSLLLSFFTSALFSSALFGQTDESKSIYSGYYVMTGNVCDSIERIPLGEASIIVNRKLGTTSDQNGNFQLLLPTRYANKNFAIRVALIMYDPVRIKVKNKQLTLTKEIKIYLKKAFVDLNKLVLLCRADEILFFAPTCI
ncbi:MAG TPA: carboxypeptidase-like regulatory domain-containing protein [Puia sp.]|nr:carboxypeptidase-like regulatory domain-containing protein [Puia sp.]